MSLFDAWSKDTDPQAIKDAIMIERKHQTEMVVAVVAAERERCAKIVNEDYKRCIDPEVSGLLFEIMRQIRSGE